MMKAIKGFLGINAKDTSSVGIDIKRDLRHYRLTRKERIVAVTLYLLGFSPMMKTSDNPNGSDAVKRLELFCYLAKFRTLRTILTALTYILVLLLFVYLV